MSLSFLIIGEIFLVLLGVSAYFLRTMFTMNKVLQNKNENLNKRLKDNKSRLKGMRIQIQEQNTKISHLEKELAKKLEADKKNDDELDKVKRQKESLQQAIEHEKSKLTKQQDKYGDLEKEVDELNKQLNDQAKEKSAEQHDQEQENYKELYHDLKNSIAYSMTGGEEALDTLRDRLAENGNDRESAELDEIKQRYNSLGEMVGLVVDVEIFDEDAKEAESDLKEIESAEDWMSEIDKSLSDADRHVALDHSNLELTKEEMNRLTEELQTVSRIKDGLAKDLEKTSSQLRAFIAKAHMFQAQKEQIRMHKGTEKQLHRNLSNMGAEYRQLTRRFKTLESRNEILSAQMKNSTKDKESVDKLNELRSQLELTEEKMDRMLVEKEMLEQQFMLMSAEADMEMESSQALERLESEHELLEQQFMDLLKELESSDQPSA